jgi:thiol-disulfide isomerase/thioredoxin
MKATAVLSAAVILLAACGGDEGRRTGSGSDTTAADTGPDSSAVVLLRRADSAAGAVGSAAYSFRLEASGPAASGLPDMSGHIAFRGGTREIPRLRARLTAEMPGGAESLQVASGADSVFLLDHSARELRYGSVENGAEELLGALGPALLGELMFDAPFADELSAREVSDLGSEEIGGLECRKVSVSYAGGGQKAVWWFGAEDYLPRRVDRIMTRGGEESVLSMVITDLETGVDLSAEDIRLTAPEGWTETEHMTFLPVGRAAPDWSLPTPAGDTLSLAALRDTVVIMDFWATWCGPCLTVMPDLQEIHEDYARRPVKVVGVNVWERGDPEALMADSGFTYALALDGDSVAADYLVTAIPTLYVIGPEGRVVYRARGAGGDSAHGIRAVVDSLLGD